MGSRDDMENERDRYLHKLVEVQETLRQWAAEAKLKGCSTQHVGPMRQLADEIDEVRHG